MRIMKIPLLLSLVAVFSILGLVYLYRGTATSGRTATSSGSHAVADGVRDGYETTRDTVSDGYKATRDTLKEGVEATKDAAHELKEAGKDAVP